MSYFDDFPKCKDCANYDAPDPTKETFTQSNRRKCNAYNKMVWKGDDVQDCKKFRTNKEKFK